jgi:putative membrane protein
MKTYRTILRIWVVAVTAAAFSLGVVTAQTSSESKTSTLSEKDKTFMKKAARGGMMEVAMGRLTEQKAQSEDVKSFGKRMVTDHGKANDELKSIAAQKNVQLPSKEPTEKWTSDKAYLNTMVRDHEKNLAEFKEEANSGERS